MGWFLFLGFLVFSYPPRSVFLFTPLLLHLLLISLSRSVFNQIPLTYSPLCFGFFWGLSFFFFFCHEPNLPGPASSPQPASPPCSLCWFSLLLSHLKRVFLGVCTRCNSSWWATRQAGILHVWVPHRVGVNREEGLQVRWCAHAWKGKGEGGGGALWGEGQRSPASSIPALVKLTVRSVFPALN